MNQIERPFACWFHNPITLGWFLDGCLETQAEAEKHIQNKFRHTRCKVAKLYQSHKKIGSPDYLIDVYEKE